MRVISACTPCIGKGNYLSDCVTHWWIPATLIKVHSLSCFSRSMWEKIYVLRLPCHFGAEFPASSSLVLLEIDMWRHKGNDSCLHSYEIFIFLSNLVERQSLNHMQGVFSPLLCISQAIELEAQHFCIQNNIVHCRRCEKK